MPDQHARLSPSAAHRWMHCPAAPAREASIADEGSVYAREGSLAHAMAARWLKELYCMPHDEEDAEIAKLSKEFDPEEILPFVAIYVDYVWSRFMAAKKVDPAAVLLIEQRLPLECVNGFGTSDAIIVREGAVDVCDLKYGKGVKVDATENPQMRIYALGAMEHLDDYNPTEVRTHIIQPRLNHTSTEAISAANLKAWESLILVPAVAATDAAGAPANAGGWCQFCKVKDCLTRARTAMAVVGMVAPNANKLTPDAMGRDVLPHLEMVKAWVTSMEQLSMEMAKSGERIPGYKMVAGRNTRTVADLDEAARRLINNGASPDDVAPRVPKTLTGLEKVVGKKEFATICGDLISRKEGNPKLVAESDPRPEISGAEAFKAIKV